MVNAIAPAARTRMTEVLPRWALPQEVVRRGEAFDRDCPLTSLRSSPGWRVRPRQISPARSSTCGGVASMSPRRRHPAEYREERPGPGRSSARCFPGWWQNWAVTKHR
jgi:hypothetical protein